MRTKFNTIRSGGYHSKREQERAKELNELESKGLITQLTEQVPFELIPKIPGVQRAISYIADFTYFKDGQFVVEDLKGYKTDIYKIKKKLFRWKYGFEITETK